MLDVAIIGAGAAGLGAAKAAAANGLSYKILEAACPSEALSICRDHDGPIHMILTDVVMPEMSGPEMFVRASKLRPDTRVLYMSAYTAELLSPHGLDSDRAFLHKPFSLAGLQRRVRQVLDGGGRPPN